MLCLLLLALPGQLGAESTEPPSRWQLPGAALVAADLDRSLTAELARKGKAYSPRTRHLRPDGSPSYANRLLLESSPYLLQHAHNPVNWYPWGDEAFETARRLGRPVLLSIGYSTCHWCHVMEEESFEDVEIATYLNENYIAVKVDREEHPEIDAIYMSAVQMMTGRGGWPMTTWLTPERKPFFGGTYFPARDGDRGTRRGFLTLLADMKSVYAEQPDQVAQRVSQIYQAVQRSMAPPTDGEVPAARETIAAAVAGYARGFDSIHGGLEQAPKFPSTLPVRLLLRHHANSGDAKAREMAELTLEKMAAGGMYDQIGGGFHRYSTDARWLVPHFEKMLYDNALLTRAYLDGARMTGRDDFARTAREILDYVAREMTGPHGAFYSATDADSPNPAGEREEGWFFTWTPEELGRVLSPKSAALVAAFYDVAAEGNFEGRSILHVRRPLAQVAATLSIDPAQARKMLAAAREKLYRARLERPAPLRDDKVLVSWNGLMISAFARAAFDFDDAAYGARAAAAAEFILSTMRHDGRLHRSFLDDRSRHNAYLDDYAFLIAGLLDLYEYRFESRWLGEAVALQATLDAHYWDASAGAYFTTSDDHEVLLAREKPSHDGAEPSGNAVALMNLARLNELTGNDEHRKRARRLLAAFGSALKRSPRGLSRMLHGLDFLTGGAKEIVLAVPQELAQAEPFLSVLRENYSPDHVRVVVVDAAPDSRLAALVPWVAGKRALKGRATAYVCENGLCQLPTADVATFRKQLGLTP